MAMTRGDRGQVSSFGSLVTAMVVVTVGATVFIIASDIVMQMSEAPEFAAQADRTTGPAPPGDFFIVGGFVLLAIPLVMVIASIAMQPGAPSLPSIRKYPVRTVGISYRHDVTNVNLYDERCIECNSRLRPGERRDWAKEFAVFGVPVYTYRGGTHYYCETCADPMALRRQYR